MTRRDALRTRGLVVTSAMTALVLLAAVLAAGLLAGPAAASGSTDPTASGRCAFDTPAGGLRGASATLRAASPAKASSSTSPSYLWSLVASSGRMRRVAPHRFLLTLRGLDRSVVQFTDRPWRKAYVLDLRDFVRGWDQWFTSDDEPNAVLSYLLPGSKRPQSIVVELRPPRYAHGVLRFRARRILSRADPLPGATTPVKVKRPPTPRRFASASLFIDSGASASGYTIGELILFAGEFVPYGCLTADGSTLPVQSYLALHAALYGLAAAFPADDRFALPAMPTTWPTGVFAGVWDQGRWLVVSDGYFPTDWYGAPPPAQVCFTAVSSYWSDYYGDLADRGGATDAGLSAVLPPGADALVLSETFTPNPQDTPMIGELRLFRASAIPAGGWLPADGRWVFCGGRYEALYAILGDSWGFIPDSSRFRLPAVTAPDGYVWALAFDGLFPSQE